MSTNSPSATSPPRSREGPWGPSWHSATEPHPYNRGVPPPPAGAPPPGYFYRGAQDYWPAASEPAYWGPPPPFEGSSFHDRQMPPPTRAPRPPPHRPYEEQQQQQTSLSRVPSSPGTAYPPRGPPHTSHRESRHANSPGRRVFKSESPAKGKKKKGDALSILANVSADMDGKDGKEGKEGKDGHGPPQQANMHRVPMPAPTSPLQRRSRPSPITPNQTPQERQRSQRHQVTPIAHNRPREQQPPNWDHQPAESRYPEYPPGGYHPRRRHFPPYGEYGPPGYHEGSPALVERGGSFDSQGDAAPYREFPPTPPSGPYYYEDHRQSYNPYWESGPYNSQGPFPPQRWNYGPPTEPYYQEYAYDAQEDTYHHPPHHHHPRLPPPPPHAAPYTYVQQPRLEEKTILRKKFSWKHYPELERFLIANRDEYLKHSNMNYTAEQKQYNNWLTERLLEVAGQHHYVFDPDDFNFVAIRDRIRCYYKSYVQTARKRGLKLPEKKKD